MAIGLYCMIDFYLIYRVIELHVDARLDMYSFDYTCIIINFYRSSILFI